MTRSYNADPTSHDHDPQLENPFEGAGEEDLRDLFSNYINDLEEVSDARYGHMDMWQSDSSTGFEGGHEFKQFVDSLDRDNLMGERLGRDEFVALTYMQSVLMKNAGRATIDEESLARHYNLDQDIAVNHELDLEMGRTQRDNKNMRKKIAERAEDPDNPMSRSELRRVNGKIRTNRVEISDIYFTRKRAEEGRDTSGADFMAEMLNRRNGEPTMDDEAFSQLRVAMADTTRFNLRTARAYARIAPKFRSDKFDPEGIIQEVDEMMLNDKLKDIMYGNSPVQPTDTMDDADYGDMPERDADTDTDSQTGSTSGTAPAGSGTGTPSGTTGGSPTPPPAAPAGSGSTPPPTPPPAGNSGNTSGNNQFTPEETAELRRIAENDRREAAESEYKAAMFALAKISGVRSSATAGVVGSSNEQDDTSLRLHDRFSKAIYERMKFDPNYSKVLSNPNLTMQERGAMINAYYMRCNHEMRNASAEAMAENWANKGARFYLRHQTAIKVGTYAFGVFTGGLHGVILARAITKGLDVASKRQSEGFDQQLAMEKSGGAGALGNAISSQESLDAVLAAIEANGEFTPENMQAIARIAGNNLSEQYEQKFVKAYRRVNRNRSLGAVGAGVAVGGVNWALGEMAYGYFDYQLHGSGGWMDSLNHLDNPTGNTPWHATVDKPWWMNMGVMLTGGATVAAGAVAAKAAQRQAQNADLRRANQEEDARIRRAAQNASRAGV